MSRAVEILVPIMLSGGCAAFGYWFMKAYKAQKHSQALLLKGAAALCFTGLAVVLSKHSGNPDYARLVLTGLLLGLWGDELLHLRFLLPRFHDLFFGAGAASFAVGHFFYMKALYDLGGIRIVILLPVFLAGLLIACSHGKKHGSNAGPLQFAGVGYMALVVFMGALSISAFLARPSLATGLFALGGICFGVSDNILYAYCFGKYPKWSMNIWVHVTYYAAQLMIAWSILFMGG